MTKLSILLLLFLAGIQLSLSAQQTEDQKFMRSFVPKSRAYNIYYPLNYPIEEGTDGIVTITDTVSGINFTLSSYHLSEKPTDKEIINQLNNFLNETFNSESKSDDWNSYKTKFDNLVELKTNFAGYNWIWYGITNKQSLVIFSLNKQTEIEQSDIDLMRFMIDNLIIN